MTNNTILTEQQILAMPEEDYMNSDQLRFFENLLKEEKNQIEVQLQSLKSDLSHSEQSSDFADLASNQELLQMNLRTMERKTKLLHKIDAAISRIHNQSFGFCVKTGEPIGIPRLIARPTATVSIDIKEIQEREEKITGEPTADNTEEA